MSIVTLYGNTWQEASLPALAGLMGSLASAGLSVEIERVFGEWLRGHGVEIGGCRLTETPSPSSSIIISVGGDGTLLKAVRWGAQSGIPIAGVNTGHLGFLTAWHMRDARLLVDAVTHHAINIVPRNMLHIECNALPPEVWPYALNDVALLKENSGSMITVRTYVDDIYLTDYEADGLVVSTPSGSTAYSLSAGGPIMQPTVPALSLTPVAPHTLTMRPLVVSDSCRISAITDSRSGSFLLLIDGTAVSLPAGTRVNIAKAPFTLRLVCRAEYTFAAALRDKLLWGASVTARSSFSDLTV